MCHPHPMNEELRDAYLEEVAAEVRYLIDSAAKAVDPEAPDDGRRDYDPAGWEARQRLRQVLVTDQHRADFTTVVAELATTLAHSFLVALDGGTALSNDGKQVYLTDRNGEEIADVLHERLFDHLDVEEAVRTALR